jgi:hypothetical protein
VFIPDYPGMARPRRSNQGGNPTPPVNRRGLPVNQAPLVRQPSSRRVARLQASTQSTVVQTTPQINAVVVDKPTQVNPVVVMNQLPADPVNQVNPVSLVTVQNNSGSQTNGSVQNYNKIIKGVGLFKLTSSSSKQDKAVWGDQLIRFMDRNPTLDHKDMLLATHDYFVEDLAYRTWWYSTHQSCNTVQEFCLKVKDSFGDGQFSKSEQRDRVRQICQQRAEECMAMYLTRLEAELLAITPPLNNEEMHEELSRGIHMDIKGEKLSRLQYTLNKYPGYKDFVTKMIDQEASVISHLSQNIAQRRKCYASNGTQLTVEKALMYKGYTCTRLIYAVSMAVDGIPPPPLSQFQGHRKQKGKYIQNIEDGEPEQNTVAPVEKDNGKREPDEPLVQNVQKKAKADKKDSVKMVSENQPDQVALQVELMKAIKVLTAKVEQQDKVIANLDVTSSESKVDTPKPYGQKLGYQGRGGFQGGRGRGKGRGNQFGSQRPYVARISCYHCGKPGHKKFECWEIIGHPSKKVKKEDETGQVNKTEPKN